MGKKKNYKNKKYIVTENNQITDNNNDELKNFGKVGGIIYLFCISVLIIFTFFENKTDHGYEKTQKGLFYLSFAVVFYNLIMSIFSINLFKEYKDSLFLILKGKYDFKDNLNQLTLANISNLFIAIIVLVFVLDWSLWGGYMFKVGTTLSIFFIFTIIEIIKRGWKSKFKK